MGATCASCVSEKNTMSCAPKIRTLLRCDFSQSHELVTVESIMEYGCYVLVAHQKTQNLSLLSRVDGGSAMWIETDMSNCESLSKFLQENELQERAKFLTKQLLEIRDSGYFSLKKSTTQMKVTLVLAATPQEIYETAREPKDRVNKFGITVSSIEGLGVVAKQCFMLYAQCDKKKKEARLGARTLLRSVTYRKKGPNANNRVIVASGGPARFLFCDESGKSWLHDAPKSKETHDSRVLRLTEFITTGMPIMDDASPVERPVLVCGPDGCQVVDAMDMQKAETIVLEEVSNSNRTYDAPSPVTTAGAIFKYAQCVCIATPYAATTVEGPHHLLQFDQVGEGPCDLAGWALAG